MKILGISGTIVGSKTNILVEKVLNEIIKVNPDVNLEVDLLDMRNYSIQFCDGRDISKYNDDTKKVIEKISTADAYIIGTPIFQGSITGVLKNLLDLVPPNVFRKKVIGFVANGGTYQHFLVLENQLKPIAGYFCSYVAPGFVYAHSSHFDRNNNIIDENIKSRIADLAKEVYTMSFYLK